MNKAQRQTPDLSIREEPRTLGPTITQTNYKRNKTRTMPTKSQNMRNQKRKTMKQNKPPLTPEIKEVKQIKAQIAQ